MKSKNLIFAFAILPSLSFGQTAAENLAKTCTACHGLRGESQNDLWPNLAGQKNGYIVKQLSAFRKGYRFDPLMSPVSKTLSDADIKLLAEYFSKLKAGS